MANQTDKMLVAACLKGDSKAQKQLYDTYSVKMYGLCLRYAKDHAEAEDMLQEGFFRVFTRLHQFAGTGALGGWIRRVMINTSLKYLQKQRRHFFAPEDLAKVSETRESAEANVFSQFGAEAIIGMIQQLPTGYRTIFNLYAIEGYSHKEIAEQMEISESTSRSQYARAKKLLRTKLEEYMITD